MLIMFLNLGSTEPRISAARVQEFNWPHNRRRCFSSSFKFQKLLNFEIDHGFVISLTFFTMPCEYCFIKIYCIIYTIKMILIL